MNENGRTGLSKWGRGPEACQRAVTCMGVARQDTADGFSNKMATHSDSVWVACAEPRCCCSPSSWPSKLNTDAALCQSVLRGYGAGEEWAWRPWAQGELLGGVSVWRN